jgi:hypothetical protein
MELSAELVVYQLGDGRWSWRLSAVTGETIAQDATPGFDDELDCQRVADAVVNGTFRDAVRLVER